jgi:hypothetical protein
MLYNNTGIQYKIIWNLSVDNIMLSDKRLSSNTMLSDDVDYFC